MLPCARRRRRGVEQDEEKDAEVLGRGEKIDAGEIGAVEQEAHMAAAGRGTGGGGEGGGTRRRAKARRREGEENVHTSVRYSGDGNDAGRPGGG